MAVEGLNGFAEHVVEETSQIGMAAVLLAQTDRKRLSIAALLAWMTTPIRLNQALFVASPEGRPVGYATWAFLEDETGARVRDGTLDFLSPEDWNDGEHLWIIDLVAPHGHLRQVIAALRERLAATHERFEYVRERHGTLDWTRRGFRPRTNSLALPRNVSEDAAPSEPMLGLRDAFP